MDLGTGVKTAAALGAQVISNSYGGPESASQTNDDSFYNQPGHTVTVSSGDSGYGVQYPASSPDVVAVGGTSLTRNSTTRGWSEAVWPGAGSGCSSYERKPPFQTDRGCLKRTVADTAAVADPNTGVAVYRTPVGGSAGWYVFGGTSAAAPIIAAIYSLAGNASSSMYSQSLYVNRVFLNDITTGSNGSCGDIVTMYLCTAEIGYDGPSGLGTPNGSGAF